MFVHGKIGLKCISQPTFRNSPALQRTLRGPRMGPKVFWKLKFGFHEFFFWAIFEIWHLIFNRNPEFSTNWGLKWKIASQYIHGLWYWFELGTLKTSEADKTKMSKPQEYNLHNSLKVVFSWPSKVFKVIQNTRS